MRQGSTFATLTLPDGAKGTIMERKSSEVLSGQDWVSVGAIMQKLEIKLGLSMVNTAALYSFRVRSMEEARKVLRQKLAIAESMRENSEKVWEYARDISRDSESDMVMVILRTLWKQYVDIERTARDHAKRAEEIIEIYERQMSMLDTTIDEEELPF